MPNKENIKKWVEALRSGNYKQIREKLHDANGFCCLGVACDVYRQETGQGEWVDKNILNSHRSSFRITNSFSADSYLHPEVKEWLELPSCNPQVTLNGINISLSAVNDDNELDFNTIADLIEKSI